MTIKLCYTDVKGRTSNDVSPVLTSVVQYKTGDNEEIIF